jgi:hypothetical protein
MLLIMGVKRLSFLFCKKVMRGCANELNAFLSSSSQIKNLQPIGRCVGQYSLVSSLHSDDVNYMENCVYVYMCHKR